MRLLALLPALLLGAVPAWGQAPLVMKGGQWQSTITGMGPQTMTHTSCFAEQPLDRSAAPPEMEQQCTKREMTRAGNGVKLDFICNGMAMTGTATMVNENTYRTDMTMQAPGGPAIHMVTDSKWIGPCKPGEKPINAGK